MCSFSGMEEVGGFYFVLINIHTCLRFLGHCFRALSAYWPLFMSLKNLIFPSDLEALSTVEFSTRLCVVWAPHGYEQTAKGT